MKSQWRVISAQYIREALRDMKDASLKEKRKALRKVYPFGQRKRWPYKMWCAEVRRHLGLPKLKTWRKKKKPDKRQLKLFVEE